MKLTNHQLELVNKVTNFTISDNDIFIIKGAAGTGKTTVVKSIIESVSKNNFVDSIVLLAPTNRAGKVLTKKTGKNVNTIHSEIYYLQEIRNKDNVVIANKFVPKYLEMNLFEDEQEKEILSKRKALFIVDESSMISASSVKEGTMVSDNPLLKDLYLHVKSYSQSNKIIFVGDSYQLPPVGYVGVAPALDKNFLKSFLEINSEIEEFELKEVLRQSEDSPILDLAEDIKMKIDANVTTYYLSYSQNKESGYSDFIKSYVNNLERYGSYDTMALGWSRKNVLQMNLDIRKELFGSNPNGFEVGDLIYVNARWTKNSEVVLKGELGRVVSVEQMEPKAKLHFHKLTIELTERPILTRITTLVFTDLAYDETENIPNELFTNLTVNRAMENQEFKKTGDASNDPYLNAMQVKFAYALTVHKSQGGEWKNVYLHHVTNWRDLRWNYTAVTRASERLVTYSLY